MKSPTIINPYEIFGVSHNATEDEIRASYKTKIKKYHPDRRGGNEELAKKLNASADILLDKQKRKEYDLSVPIPAPAPEPEPTSEEIEALIKELENEINAPLSYSNPEPILQIQSHITISGIIAAVVIGIGICVATAYVACVAGSLYGSL